MLVCMVAGLTPPLYGSHIYYHPNAIVVSFSFYKGLYVATLYCDMYASLLCGNLLPCSCICLVLCSVLHVVLGSNLYEAVWVTVCPGALFVGPIILQHPICLLAPICLNQVFTYGRIGPSTIVHG
jgi:hypothetical protein